MTQPLDRRTKHCLFFGLIFLTLLFSAALHLLLSPVRELSWDIFMVAGFSALVISCLIYISLLFQRIEILKNQSGVQRRLEKKIYRINEAFLNLGLNPRKNMETLTSVCGELLGGELGFYCRIEGEKIKVVAPWRMPAEFPHEVPFEGSFGQELIRGNVNAPTVFSPLGPSRFKGFFAFLIPYGFQTLIAHPVRRNGQMVGFIGIFYRSLTEPQDDDKQILGVAASAIAIEEDRLHEEATRRRQEEAIDASIDGIAVIDNGKLVYANPAYYRMYGYDRDQDCLLGSPWSELVSERDRTRLIEECRPHFAQHGYWRAEVEGIRKDGSTLDQEVTLTRAGSGQVIAIARDLSEQKRMEKLIMEQRAKILSSSKLSALGEMAGGIAHEINTPLGILHLRAGQLKHMATIGALDSKAGIDMAEKILKTAQRIARTVKSLRTLARDGSQDPLSVVSVQQIVDDTLELCREKFKFHDVDLRVSPIRPELTIQCRSNLISQVILNLLNNALDAVEPLPEKWVRLNVRELGLSQIEFTVEDSGRGIPAAIRERILEPFFTTKPLGKGTGLGLSISRGIIEEHGGSLTLDSSATNTKFVFRLPATAATVTSSSNPTHSANP